MIHILALIDGVASILSAQICPPTQSESLEQFIFGEFAGKVECAFDDVTLLQRVSSNEANSMSLKYLGDIWSLVSRHQQFSACDIEPLFTLKHSRLLRLEALRKILHETLLVLQSFNHNDNPNKVIHLEFMYFL